MIDDDGRFGQASERARWADRMEPRIPEVMMRYDFRSFGARLLLSHNESACAKAKKEAR
jgi:hypothetical protein